MHDCTAVSPTWHGAETTSQRSSAEIWSILNIQAMYQSEKDRTLKAKTVGTRRPIILVGLVLGCVHLVRTAAFVPALSSWAVLPTGRLEVGQGARGSCSGSRATGLKRCRGDQPRRRGITAVMQAKESRNLFECIEQEEVEILRSYVERGGPVHVEDAHGDTAMTVAANTGNLELVKVLASSDDVDVNYPSFFGGETPLMIACTRGDSNVVEFLVKEKGANVNAVNHRGDTALNLAAFWGKVDCVRLLLEQPSTNTEIRNIRGKRAGDETGELMRDDSHDEEVLTLLRESRIKQGILRP